MSFILDALRKSDAERQRTTTPGLADARFAVRPARRTVWVPVLVLVLVVILAANAVLLGLQWFNRSPAPAPAGVSPSPEQVPTNRSQQTDRTAFTDLRSLAEEADFNQEEFSRNAPGEDEREPESEPAELAEPPLPAGIGAEPSASPDLGAALENTKGAKSAIRDALPTLDQLLGAGTVSLPALNLDLHVYSDQRTQRFVIINTRKYVEGDKLLEGPTLESITPEGVILLSQGQRFSLLRK